jgi:hypothetical protein
MVTPSRFYTEPPYKVRKTITFTGAANLGAVGAAPLFTVTGEVMVAFIVPFCTTDLVENGATTTMALGVTGNTALFIAASEPEDIDANEFWQALAPADVGGVALLAALQDILVSANILLTIANDTVTGGVLELTCYWWPLSDDGSVVAA